MEQHTNPGRERLRLDDPLDEKLGLGYGELFGSPRYLFHGTTVEWLQSTIPSTGKYIAGRYRDFSYGRPVIMPRNWLRFTPGPYMDVPLARAFEAAYQERYVNKIGPTNDAAMVILDASLLDPEASSPRNFRKTDDALLFRYVNLDAICSIRLGAPKARDVHDYKYAAHEADADKAKHLKLIDGRCEILDGIRSAMLQSNFWLIDPAWGADETPFFTALNERPSDLLEERGERTIAYQRELRSQAARLGHQRRKERAATQ